MSARLRVEPPGAPAFERDVAGRELILGRGETAGLIVPDASVSRQHVRLFSRDGRWWAEDLGARNGTMLNGAPLGPPAAQFGPGDWLKIGETVVRFLPPAAAAAGAARDTAAAVDSAQAARLQTLNEIHRALATPISLADLLALILERCFDVLHPEEGVIVLRQADGTYQTAATRSQRGASADVLVSRSIIEEVAGRGRPALVIDAALDDRFSSSESIIAAGVRSVVAAPLAVADGSIGMIALLSRVNVRKFSPQDLDMLASLASAAALRIRNVALVEEAAARKVLERELALAHDIQMAMLPRRVPDRSEIDLAVSVTPARSVGGDLYDFVVDGDRLWFTVADVSGKGVPAALYTAVVKTLFRATVRGAAGPADVLARMNEELARDNDQMMFTTAIAGALSLTSGALVIADAGHTSPLLRQHGVVAALDLPKNVALGVLDGAEFHERQVPLAIDDVLVLFTDGATDARSATGEMFGDARLERVIASSGATANDVVRAITSATDAFSAGAPPEDDLTLLVLRYRGGLKQT